MKDGKLEHIDGAGHDLRHGQFDRTTEVLIEFNLLYKNRTNKCLINTNDFFIVKMEDIVILE